MLSTRPRTLLAAVLVALLAPAARAQPNGEGDVDVLPDREEPGERPVLRPLRIPLALLETLSVLVPPMIYYWSTTPVQKEDFDMDWDWPSWKTKLTSTDAFIFDTNPWVPNAIRHPLAGYMSYEVGRANGFAPFPSVVLAAASGATWEYFVEYKERISVNDLFVNAASAFLIGEPLFQIGRLADQAGASWARQDLALLASPFHRVHALRGYSSWLAPPRGWLQLETSLGTAAGTYNGDLRGDARLALDLEIVTDHRYGRPGARTVRFAPGAWNRVVADARFVPTELSSVRFATQTTYGARYTREIDSEGTGHDFFIGAGAGVDYLSQRLASEWDQLFVMHLIGPRVAVSTWNHGLRVAWELAGYADIGMIYAHAFGPHPPFAPLPQYNVVQSRGYYYGTGASIATRLRADTPRWVFQLEGTALQMWSIDGLDRVEHDGGADDPHDITDQRLFVRASIGVRPTLSDWRLELGAESALRRGAWQDQERWTTELATRADLVFGF